MAARRSLAVLTVLAALVASGAKAARAGDAPKRTLTTPFFVFNNGVQDATYDTPAIDPGPPAYDPRLPEVIRSPKGRQTMLWLNVTSRAGTYAPSSRQGDAAAIAAVGEVADMARASGVPVMLYPHVWFWLETVDHAISLVEKLGRPDVGLTFNLPHWLAQTRPEDEKGLLVALPASLAFGVAAYAPLGPGHAGQGALPGGLGAAAIGIVAAFLGGTERLLLLSGVGACASRCASATASSATWPPSAAR